MYKRKINYMASQLSNTIFLLSDNEAIFAYFLWMPRKDKTSLLYLKGHIS